MQRNVNWYFERAKEKTGIPSYRKLGAAIGITEGSVSQLRTGRAFPSDETMTKLANLAEENPMRALIDLNIWRTSGSARETYLKLEKGLRTGAQILGISCLLAAPMTAPSPAEANSSVSPDKHVFVYYGK